MTSSEKLDLPGPAELVGIDKKEAYEVERVSEESVSPPEEDFPDGGLRAWLVVMCNVFATIGYANSWGVFQSYYQRVLLVETSPSSIAWIGSIQYALIMLPALVIGRLFDLGYLHSITIPASAVIVIATFLTAHCKEYWQFLLCHGIANGVASGCVFSPTAAIIAHWFKKRRGFAMGFWAVGAALGGTILPIAGRFLLSSVGFQWTMRTFALIFLLVLGLSNILVRRRLPPRNVQGGLVNLRAFKHAPYSVYCLSALVTYLGLYSLLTYVAVSATSMGISQNFAFYFVSFGNVSSLFGRYFAGVVSDRLGPMNVMIPFTVGAGLLTYCWPFAHTKESLIAVTVLYGFCTGVWISLMCNPVTAMGDTADVGRRIGMLFTIMAVGAVAGPPISGAIATSTGDFTAVGFHAGSCVIASAGLILVSRYVLLGKMSGRA